MSKEKTVVMSTDEIVQVLRWIAKNDESVFSAEMATEAADTLEEQARLINDLLKKVREARKMASCKNCKYFATEKITGLHWCRSTGGLDGNLKETDYCSRREGKA